MTSPRMLNLLAVDLPATLGDHLMLVVGALIVAVGLFGFGMGDLLRFSPKRVWAISGVCLSESIRRRILWIVPLAILGLIIVVQLQQPIDEQDAIRQTTKFCLFASGLVVITSTIILACTSLPREIENRVIFTIVTKPTTRLEIVLGKVLGFAKVSLTILLIMGLFTFAYLQVRAWSLRSNLRDRLTANSVEQFSRPTLQHYVDAGLLNAKSLAQTTDLNVYGQLPLARTFRRYPQPEGIILVPFTLPPDMLASANPEDKGPGLAILTRVGFDPTATTKFGSNSPRISVQIFDDNANTAVGLDSIHMETTLVPAADGSGTLLTTVPASFAAGLTKFKFIFVAIQSSGDGAVWIEDNPNNPPVSLLVPVTTQATPLPVKPMGPSIYTGRDGVTGQQVKGDPSAKSQVAVYRFRDIDLNVGGRQDIPIELRVGVEKSGEASDVDLPTDASVEVINAKTAFDSGQIAIHPENNKTVFLSVPAAAVNGGSFNLIVRCLSKNQWLNVRHDSVNVVEAESSFALNLLKSLTVLWLLSVLVTAISVFCSTFLSWPIAVILTLVVLLGRWGVDQLGDTATAGIGRQFVTDFGVKDPNVSHALSDTVEQLNSMLKRFASVLPDIEQFSATEDIERGISIPGRVLSDSLFVLIGFGVPLTVLAYLILKNKEVAP